MASERGIKRKALTINDKLKILKVYEEGYASKKKQKYIALELGIQGSTLRSILKKRNEIEKNAIEGGCKRQKVKPGKQEDAEEVLVEWIREATSPRDLNEIIDDVHAQQLTSEANAAGSDSSDNGRGGG